ncbi:MAG: hypothetical protein OXM61_00445 [Candidatus Poribacteria bacterium]|nr:hypothetical protein [Candidatus Poribacteria bacterium]
MPKNKTGICALCNTKNVTLTEEHIFPGAKRNRCNNLPFEATLFNDAISTPIVEGQSTMNLKELKKKGLVRHKQGGQSVYSLCKKCNNNTGSWYGNAYIDWKNQWDQIRKSYLNQNSKSIKGKITFNPLRFLKQIVSCFISVDYLNHSGNPSIEDNLRNIQPEFFDFVLDPQKRYNFNNLRIFVHLLWDNNGQGHYTGHIMAHDLVKKKDLYPYTLNLIDGYIQYSLLFDTNSPYEPKHFGRQILDISKYSMYTDRQTTKFLRLEEIEWIFKIRAVPETKQNHP